MTTSAEMPTDPKDARFCTCGAERGHYGWQRCSPKPRELPSFWGTE